MNELEVGEALTSRASSIWEGGDVRGNLDAADWVVGGAMRSFSRWQIRRCECRENSPLAHPNWFFAVKKVGFIGLAVRRCILHGSGVPE